MKPEPYIVTEAIPRDKERANDGWARLGKKMGFESMTVQPVSGKSQRFAEDDPAAATSKKKSD